jgi:hypothetical protein
MDPKVSALERAFQLARSGRGLAAEGMDGVSGG